MIEKSVPRITLWHHRACRVMTNGDPQGQILISQPQTNNGLFFLLAIKYSILCFEKKLPVVTEYDEIRLDMMMSLYHNNDVT